MSTRRGDGGDDAGGSDGRGNGNEDLPPPPHPTPAEMMAQVMETQRSMLAKGKEETSIKDLNLTSLALSRTSLTPSLLFLRKQKSLCR